MITITIRKEKDAIVAFSVTGHAEYADEGQDIVCSAVSALTINAVNSIERFTSDRISVAEADGELHAEIRGTAGPETQLLLQSMLLGLQTVGEQYPRYVRVKVADC